MLAQIFGDCLAALLWVIRLKDMNDADKYGWRGAFMDENYLDNLLNEISLDKELDHKIEDELDSQMLKEKQLNQKTMSEEEVFNMDLEQDAGQIEEASDLHFSEEQIEELDRLDHLADMDIGDVDFSDIDFEDVDVTKLNDVQGSDLDEILKEFEGDLEIDDFYDKENKESQQSVNGDMFLKEKENGTEQMAEMFADSSADGHNDNLNEDTFNADQFLDSLLGESSDTKGKNENANDDLDSRKDSLHDLISSFDMGDSMMSDDIKSAEANDKLLDTADTDMAGETDGFSDAKEMDGKKKNNFMQLLFGDPDEDDELSEEELKEIEAKKEAKKAKKQAAKEAKKEKAEIAKEKKAIKAKQNDEKKKLKAEKKTQEAAQENEPEKKLNTFAVLFIFSLFLGGVFLLYIGVNNINYTQAVEKAANYFSSQKYRRAYDEIVGIDVQEKDKELKDRIYTVMYVERLYESYENNLRLEREEKALDALLRGVDKYYEHYDEAGKLGITKDLDYSLTRIQEVLLKRYGISVEQAVELNQLENEQYVQAVKSYIQNIADTNVQ